MKDKQSINTELQERYKDKLTVANKLASHFGIPKADLQETIDWEDDQLYSDLLAEFGFDYRIRCSAIKTNVLKFSVLWTAKFFKSTIYELYLTAEAENGGQDDSFLLAINLVGVDDPKVTPLIMYRLDDLDDFQGGTLIRLNEDELFALEPLSNFLKIRFPKSREE